jgi:hypothetical protein
MYEKGIVALRDAEWTGRRYSFSRIATQQLCVRNVARGNGDSILAAG